MASILDITLSDDENPQEIDSEDSEDGFKVFDNFTKEPPKKKFRRQSGESSPTPVTPPLTPGPPEDTGKEPSNESTSKSQKKSSPVMKGSSDAPPTPASTPPPANPTEKESEIIEIDNEDEPTPATVNSTLENGQLISKCPFGVFKSRLSALVSKKRSNQKNNGTLSPLIGGFYFDSLTLLF